MYKIRYVQTLEVLHLSAWGGDRPLLVILGLEAEWMQLSVTLEGDFKCTMYILQTGYIV